MPQTLLLADDSVTIQRVIELTFADEDIRVVAVSDGDQAITELGKNPPDIVLADVGMPGRDGYQVAEHIKRSPALAHIPVLLLTGAFEPIDQARAAQVGCDGVLAKPFEPQLVIGRVKELLSKPKTVPAPTEAAPTTVPPTPEPAWNGSAPLGEPPPPAPVSPRAPEEVDKYFDRLDRAFANLSTGAPDEPLPPLKAPSGEIDWFSTPAPLAPAPPVEDCSEAPPPASTAEEIGTTASSATVAAAIPASVPALPELADAFAALLAAEQNAPPPLSAPRWRAAEEPPAPLSAQDVKISDEVIEEIVRRVLERMSDRVVREIVGDIASETAERMVREEIERIKGGAPRP